MNLAKLAIVHGGLLGLRLLGMALALGFVAYVIYAAGLSVLGAYAAFQATSILIAAVSSAAASRRLAATSAVAPVTSRLAFREMGRAGLTAGFAAVAATGLMMIAFGLDPWLAVMLVTPALSMNQALSRALNYAHHTNAGFGVERILSPAVSLAVLVVLQPWLDMRLAVGMAVVIGPLVSTAYLILAARCLIPDETTTATEPDQSLHDVAPFMLSIFLDYALTAGLLLISKAMIPPSAAGALAFAQTLAGALSVVHLAVAMPFIPRVSQAWREGDLAASRALLRRSQVSAGTMAVVFGALLLVFVGWIAPLLFPHRPVSIPLLAILGLGHVSRAFSGSSYFILESVGRRWQPAIVQSAALGALIASAATAIFISERTVVLATGFALALAVRTVGLQMFTERLWGRGA